MRISPQSLKNTLSSLKYKWYNDRPNIIGIRSTLQVPDIFNDFLCLVFKQPSMPQGLSLLRTQKWLNSWLYRGINFKPLDEDGVNGKNTQYALKQYLELVNKDRLLTYVTTTEPGVYYQKVKLLNPKGCAVMKPGQYLNCYRLGTHIKPDHKALIQTGGKITVWRDNDRNGIAENLGVEDTGYFGCNIHGAQRIGKTAKIGAYSAGCQVFESWSDKEELIRICEHFKASIGNRFTYTLVNEVDLIN